MSSNDDRTPADSPGVPQHTAIEVQLRACALALRTRPTKLETFIPLLHRAADEIERLNTLTHPLSPETIEELKAKHLDWYPQYGIQGYVEFANAVRSAKA